MNISKQSMILSELVSSAVQNDYENFRNNLANQKLSQWNPEIFGGFYFRQMLANSIDSLNNDQINMIDKIANRNIGKPISIIDENGRSIDYNYLSSIFEIDFLGDILLEINEIAEIGAGYGRTCHSILSCYPNIKKYKIIDLESSICLSKRYLSDVLSHDLFNKIHFISVDKLDDGPDISSDLFIAIDCMNEMTVNAVNMYRKLIDNSKSFFYVKAPIAKYRPIDVGLKETNTESVERALQTGVLVNKINIFNGVEYNGAIENFIDTYRPSDHFNVIKQSKCKPVSYFYQALYQHLEYKY